MKETIKFRKFRLSPENERYLLTELAFRGIPCFTETEDGQLYCYAKCSGEKFHAAHTRAVCERLTVETGLIHMSRAESEDSNLFFAILMRYGYENGGYAVII